MAYTTIDDPSEYFHTRLYSGNNSGSGLAVTNDANSGNFQPDWVWIKRRDSSGSHGLHDSNRGSTKRLKSDSNEAEDTNSNILASFDSNGFTIGDNSGNYNASGTYVAWQWKANGGTTSSNSNGGITSTVQANTTAGFSVVTYTGTGSANTVGHGLGSTVAMVITKSRDSASSWQIYHKDLGKDKTIQLEQTASTSSITNYWGTSTPNSTVFGVIGGGYNNNLSGEATIAYCFAEIEGYSKFGSYTGNGSSDGTFVYTGFRPAWVIAKKTSAVGSWHMWDIKRDTTNANSERLLADTSDAEATLSGVNIDHLSNGFKLRNSDGALNGSGATYIYLAFAEHPFVSSKGVPVTAR